MNYIYIYYFMHIPQRSVLFLSGFMMSDLTVSLGLDAGGFVAGMRRADQAAQKGTAALNRAYKAAAKSINGLTEAQITRRVQTLRNLGVSEREAGQFAESARSLTAYKRELAAVEKGHRELGIQFDRSSAAVARHLQRFGEHARLLSLNTIRTRELAAAQGYLNAKPKPPPVQTPALLQGAAAAFGLRELAALSDEWTTLNNRIRLVTASEAELVSVRRGLMDSANRTGQSLRSTAELYQRLAAAQKELGLDSTELLAVTDTVNKAMVIGGTSAASGEAALIQLAQAMAAGTLRGEELNSVLEQAPALAQTIAKGMGIGVGELRRYAAEGKLTSRAVVEALQKMRGEVDGQFGGINLTISQAAQIFKNRLTEFVGGGSEASGAAKLLAGGLRLAADNLNLLAGAALALGGVKLAAWLLTGTAALVLQAKAAQQAGLAQLFHARAVQGSGAAALQTAAANLTLAQSLGVLGGAARASAGYLKGGIASAAALGGAVLGLEAAVKAAFGRDASNAASDFFDGVLHDLGLIDKEVESLGTKLYDVFHDAAGNFDWGKTARAAAEGMVEGFRLAMPAIRPLIDKTFEGSATRAVPENWQAYSRYRETGYPNPADGKSLEELNKSIAETVLKYREQAQTVGKSSEEIAVMRLEAMKTAAMEQQRAEVARNRSLNEEQAQAVLAETQAAYTRDIDAARQAMQAFAQASEAGDLRRSIGESAEKLRAQAAAAAYLAQAAKAGSRELELWDLHLKAARLAGLDKAAAEAAQADLAKARAAADLIDQYERQKAVMQTLDDLRYELATAGMDRDQKRLYDLQQKGASQAQLAEAAKLLEGRRKIEEAANLHRQAAADSRRGAEQNLHSAGEFARAAADIDRAAQRMNAPKETAKDVAQQPKPTNEITAFVGSRVRADPNYGRSYTLRLESGGNSAEGRFITRDNLPRELEAFLRDQARAYRN